MKQDILIRVIYEGSTYDLDIDSGIPLRLDVSAVENQKIGKFFGVGSQTFDLPGTKRNNRFFKNPWTIGAEDIPALYNTIPGYIIYNGETLLEGQFQLLEVVNDDNGYINYKCQITDNVIQFNDTLADKLIIDADFSEYDHTLTSGSIIDSWSDNLLSGSVFYPMADYGRDDTIVFPSTPRIQVSGDSSGTGSIDNQISPMQVQQFLPTIRARDVIRAIFNQVDYNYTSSLIDGPDWDKLYLLPRAKEELGIVGLVQENTLDVDMSVQQDISILQPGGTVTTNLDFDTEIADPGNNYNPITYTYTAPYTGVYVIDVSIELSVDAGQADTQTLNLSFAGWGTTIDLPPGTYNTTVRLNRRVTLIGGEPHTAKVRVEYTNPNADLELFVIPGDNTYLRVPKALSIYDNAPVDMALQFESKTKSIDLLNGFIEHFNLIVTPEPQQDKTLRIETFDTWVRQGRNVDWTDKVNNAKRVAVSQTVEQQQKELRFTNAEDNDRFSVATKQNDPNFQYGTQRVIASSNIPKGEKEIGKTFAPVILGSAIDSGSLDLDGVTAYNLGDSNFVLPHLYKYENNNQVSFKFKNRLGYKVDGLTPVGAFNNQVWIGNSGSAQAVEEYSTISNLSQVPAVQGTKDLHFSNDYNAYIPTDLNPYGGTDNYQLYWETYVNSLYWDGSKKLVVDIKFRQDEYKDIQLNDIIFIKDQRYRINKISGINLSNDDVARVELIRLFPAYYTDVTIDNCNFDFEAIDYIGTTTTSTSTSTTQPVTTTSTTTLAPFIEAYMDGSTSGSFVSGSDTWNYISWFHTESTNQNNTLQVLSGTTTDAKLLLIGGGGAGGWDDNVSADAGGGGGAGQVRYINNVSVSSGSYSITVGKGGLAPLQVDAGDQGGDGGNSSALGYTSGYGAGGGGTFPNNAGRNAAGGSGGGSAESGTIGTGTQSNGGSSNANASGGGGGATGNGSNGGSNGGNGGPGITFNGIIGTALSVGGGGGGGSSTGTDGTATSGGGNAGNAATDGTGGGGGGATFNNPGDGGSGRFILTYKQPPTTTTTTQPVTTTSTTTSASFYTWYLTTSGYVTANDACNGGAVSTVVYTDAIYDDVLSFSDFNTRFYTDSGLTTAFDGNGDYWGISDINGGQPDVWGAIVGSGFLNSHGDCIT